MSQLARKNGITFQLDETYEFRGYKIPQSELYEIAKESNITDIVKQGCAIKWIAKQKEKHDVTPEQ